MPHLSLNNKILLLVYGAIIMVLLLIGSIFYVQMTQLHESTTRSELSNSVELLRADLLKKRQYLIDSSERMVKDDTVRAALNLIFRYQDIDNYQKLVFDPEKRKLASLLEELVSTIGFNMASLHEANGKLIAFHGVTSKGEAGVYQAYRDGKAVLVPVRGMTQVEPAITLYSEFGDLLSQQHAMEETVHFHAGRGATSVVLELTLPVELELANSEAQLVGWLRLAYLLDRAYIEEMTQLLGVKAALISDQGYISSGGFIPKAYAHRTVTIPQLRLSGNSSDMIAWLQSEHGFEAHTALPTGASKQVYLVLGEGKSDLAENLNIFTRTVFWVLLLAGISVLPIGFYLTRRWVTRPIKQLTEVAQGITSGERPQAIAFKRKDELGMLANAFEVMSVAITHRENELRDKQRQIEGIIGNAPAVIYMKDLGGRYLLVNSLFEDIFSVSSQQMYGKTDSELFRDSEVAQIRQNDLAVLENKVPMQMEEELLHDGKLHTYLSVKFPLFNDNNKVVALCGISTDITERKRAENELRLAKNIIQNASEAVVVTTLEGIIVDVNEAFEEITGYSRDEVIGLTPSVNKSGRHDKAFYQEMWGSIRENGVWQGEIWDRRKSGEIYPKWLSINTVRNEQGEPSHYVGIFSDISIKKATEDQLEKLAYFDSLTGLPNRLLFRDRLNQEIAAARRHASKVALLFIDLDRFKVINDTHGHSAGDELLQLVAQRLNEQVRGSDTVSRLGGDEFTVIIPDIAHEEDVSGVAQKIVEAMDRPFLLRGQEARVGASVGIAIYPDDGENLDSLSQHADMALYKAKEEGRNNFQFFSEEMQTHITERFALEDDLRKGMQRDEFLLYYQPKYSLDNDKISGMESLVRWQQPERGMVSPADFIPLAEETGLIIPLSDRLLREACCQTAKWNSQREEKLKVAVNLSAKQFQQKNLANVVQEILQECSLPAEFLELELTESMVMGDVEAAIQTMRSLRDLGLSLAIDDFGTGYSSLSYLKRFPITTLKIDKSFVRDLTIDSDDASIVQAIIAMGRQLDLHVVAEGVETEEQLDFLRQYECEEVQGYLKSRPLPGSEFEKLILGEG